MENGPQSASVFDDAPRRSSAAQKRVDARRREPEEARIALRCNRKELQLVDSFVASGEFPTRSELMRAALHAFLRSRALSTAPNPPVDAEGYVEVPVRLTPEEYAEFDAFAHHIGNRQSVKDALAMLIRRGALELKVTEMAQKARTQAREAAETRTQVGALQESAKDMERKGFVGR